MSQNLKKHNHLYPTFHINKWKQFSGKIFDRESMKPRPINNKDFTQVFYYSNGQLDQTLEDRISKFEAYIGRVIKKIDCAKETVILSGKELELLKLYTVLCANRHHYSIEVITQDESGIYKNNNYIFGIHTLDKQEKALEVVSLILDDFEKIKLLTEDTSFIINDGSVLDPKYIQEKSSLITAGLHLATIRCTEPSLMVSDCVAITENTMDSDYLYTYVPISPTTAILLVKSKYYFDESHFEYTKQRFGITYGCGKPDPFISELFGGEFDCEDKLFCSYASSRTVSDKVEITIQQIPSLIFAMFNSLYFEDGKIILYVRDQDLELAQKPLNCRKITIG